MSMSNLFLSLRVFSVFVQCDVPVLYVIDATFVYDYGQHILLKSFCFRDNTR